MTDVAIIEAGAKAIWDARRARAGGNITWEQANAGKDEFPNTYMVVEDIRQEAADCLAAALCEVVDTADKPSPGDTITGETVRGERSDLPPPPISHVVATVPCPCTLIEQDEDTPIGYPSLLCGICEGKGHTTQEQVTALACEMIKIASDVGEPEDPFAAWESIDLLKSQAATRGVDVEDIREQKLATIVAPDNGTTDEVLAAVLECATAWVPEARIIGNVRAGDVARAIRAALSAPEAEG